MSLVIQKYNEIGQSLDHSALVAGAEWVSSSGSLFPEEMCCNGSEVLSDEKKICTKP